MPRLPLLVFARRREDSAFKTMQSWSLESYSRCAIWSRSYRARSYPLPTASPPAGKTDGWGKKSDDTFLSYRTGVYKLHYYETPTNLKFVMLTDIKTNALRAVLHQIYVNLYVEFGMLKGVPSWDIIQTMTNYSVRKQSRRIRYHVCCSLGLVIEHVDKSD